MSKQVLSILIEDKFGALSRITELFSSRGYNLNSICSGACEEPNTQRLTLMCNESDENTRKIIQLLKQIIFVYDIKLIETQESIHSELMLVKLELSKDRQADFLKVAAQFNLKVMHSSDQSICVRAVGYAEELDKLLNLVRQYSVLRVSRTGEAAIHR